MLSAQQVTEHNSRESCWVIVSGEVYDVTEFLDDHPGGAASILRCAGRVSGLRIYDADESVLNNRC